MVTEKNLKINAGDTSYNITLSIESESALTRTEFENIVYALADEVRFLNRVKYVCWKKYESIKEQSWLSAQENADKFEGWLKDYGSISRDVFDEIMEEVKKDVNNLTTKTNTQ
jgi:hypothetical protein